MVKALNTPPSKNLLGAAVTAPMSHKERDDNYNSVIVQLAPRWRVIVCKDGMQWIVQQKEASHGGPWRAMERHELPHKSRWATPRLWEGRSAQQ